METASRLNITGWVRNTFDGNVELTAEGFRSDLDELLEIIGRGPRGSFVTNVNSRWETPSGAYDQFSILPTG
jgi:acylphosphatase